MRFHFNAEGKFKILQLTDIHYLDGRPADQKTLELMRQLIEAEKPDFIAVTGDAVFGPDNYVNLTSALAPVTESGIPWSWTFGNHDAEDGTGRDALFEKIKTMPGSAAYNADDTIPGTGNHDLHVLDQTGRPVWTLSFLDSGDYLNQDPGGYDFVKMDQVVWLQKRIREVEQQNPEFSSLLFIHIPLPEHDQVWQESTCYGEKNEAVCCSKLNSGLFAALKLAGHARGVFCGHDHVNDYMGDFHGIQLGYGRACGYNTYGLEGFERGARVFEIAVDDTENFKTWLRLADGRVLGATDRPNR